MERRRIDDLLGYLRLLTDLNRDDFRVAKEIGNVMRELDEELYVRPWDRAATYEVRDGILVVIEDGTGRDIRIEGPSELTVLPL
ncbi:hypothetical protein EEL30_15760 [Brevibacillus laterosporus]|uniref:Uncharacterized protein n=1 Tax=Brevibacillus laterosporus TaxID=1465 RepID=A0A518V9I4_BRELA|nr:hypothetical protein EEL30_15760 [Brevibacillus laterosporus]